jgi:hypothetical protein
MDIINWDRIVIAIVAAYGAIMSTITFILRRKEKQRQIKVSLSNGVFPIGQDPSELMLIIEVSNPGIRDVTINVPSIILPDRRSIVFPNPQSNVQFPYKLEEGTKCLVWSEMKNLAQILKRNGFTGIIKINVEVCNDAGRKYKSKKPWKLNIDEWASK